MSLQFDNPVQPVLAMPADLAIWQHCASMSSLEAHWRIYLQQIGLAALLTWLQEESELPVRAWPQPIPLDVWHMVDGLALTLGHKRLVVMLDEAIDAAELRVPQEWVDISDWIADYYIAAYIDVDEEQLVPWGYTTHAQLKALGAYDASDRTYTLRDDNLVQDFSVFWVAQQLEQVEATPVEELPDLSPTQADTLIQRLADAPDPRLEIPFIQWGALLKSDRWRQSFYQLRQGLAPINLGGWANQIFDQGWQTLESLLASQSPALGFRSGSVENTVTRGKTIRLITATTDVEIVLALTVKTEADERRHIRIQLHPSEATLLPSDVTLTLELPDREEPLQVVRSTDRDNYIQLPPFRCQAGRPFKVGIYLADATVHEDFIS